MNQAELQLVRAAQDGDRTAFGRLVERFKGRVYATAFAISGNAEEAQELTQETFVRALQNMPRLEQPEKFTPWLRGITHTIGKDVRRRAARERRHLEGAARTPQREVVPPDAQVAGREARVKEHAVLAELVATLPENTRVALDLRFREGLSYQQIAQVMGVPASTVRGLLHRGTKALRLKFKPMLQHRKGQ